MRTINLAQKLKNYRNGWVSVSSDHKKVLAYSRDLKQLLTKVEKLGKQEGLILKVGKRYDSYVG